MEVTGPFPMLAQAGEQAHRDQCQCTAPVLQCMVITRAGTGCVLIIECLRVIFELHSWDLCLLFFTNKQKMIYHTRRRDKEQTN